MNIFDVGMKTNVKKVMAKVKPPPKDSAFFKMAGKASFGELCQNCHKREATVDWVGEGGVLDWTHGLYKKWCKVCVLEAQLKYARKIARNIPKLVKAYKKLVESKESK